MALGMSTNPLASVMPEDYGLEFHQMNLLSGSLITIDQIIEEMNKQESLLSITTECAALLSATNLVYHEMMTFDNKADEPITIATNLMMGAINVARNTSTPTLGEDVAAAMVKTAFEERVQRYKSIVLGNQISKSMLGKTMGAGYNNCKAVRDYIRDSN